MPTFLSVSPSCRFVTSYQEEIQQRRARYSTFSLDFCACALLSFSVAIVRGYKPVTPALRLPLGRFLIDLLSNVYILAPMIRKPHVISNEPLIIGEQMTIQAGHEPKMTLGDSSEASQNPKARMFKPLDSARVHLAIAMIWNPILGRSLA